MICFGRVRDEKDATCPACTVGIAECTTARLRGFPRHRTAIDRICHFQLKTSRTAPHHTITNDSTTRNVIMSMFIIYIYS